MALPTIPSTHRWVDGGAVVRYVGNSVTGPGKDDVVFCWDLDTDAAVTDLYDQYGNHVDRLPLVDKTFRAAVPKTVAKPVFSVGVTGVRFSGNDWEAVANAQSAAASAASSAALVGSPAKSAMDAAMGVDVATIAPGTSASLARWNVLPGNTAAQNEAGFAAAASNSFGLTDFTLPAGDYHRAQASFGNWLMTFTGKSKIRIRGLGARIIDDSTYSNNGPIEGLFLFDNCKDVEVSGIEYVGPALPTPALASSGGNGGLGYQGATLVRAINGTDGVKVDLRATNCRYGVQTGDYADATKGQCKNFDVKIRGSMIGYPIAAYYADNITHDIDVDGFHRMCYVAGTNGVRGIARGKDQYIAPYMYLITDCLTSGTDAAAQANPTTAPTTSRGCHDIDVTVIDKGSTVFQNPSAVASINLSRGDTGIRFENTKVRVYTVGTDTVSTKVGGFVINSTVSGIWSRYTYNWDPSMLLDNIEVSGVVDHSAQTVASNGVGELYISTTDTAGAPHNATIGKISVKGLTIKQSQAANPRPVFIDARDPYLLELDGLYAPGQVLSLVTSTTVPTLIKGTTLKQIAVSGAVSNIPISLGAGNFIDSVTGSAIVRTAGHTGIGGAGAVIMQKETTLTLSGASTTWSAAIPGGSILLGVQGRVQTAITGASGIQVGVTGDLTRFRNGDGTTVGTTFGPNAQAVATNPLWYIANTDIVVTARTANFTGGQLRLVVSYITFPTPTA